MSLAEAKYSRLLMSREAVHAPTAAAVGLTSATIWSGSSRQAAGLRVRCSRLLKLRTRPGSRLGWCPRMCGR